MRPETPVPLTLEEHRDLGLELRNVNARVRELRDLMVSVYGPNNRAAFSFIKAAEAMDRLCEDLQTQAAMDHPGYAADRYYT